MIRESKSPKLVWNMAGSSNRRESSWWKRDIIFWDITTSNLSFTTRFTNICFVYLSQLEQKLSISYSKKSLPAVWSSIIERSRRLCEAGSRRSRMISSEVQSRMSEVQEAWHSLNRSKGLWYQVC